MGCANVLTWELNRYGRRTDDDDGRHTLNLNSGAQKRRAVWNGRQKSRSPAERGTNILFLRREIFQSNNSEKRSPKKWRRNRIRWYISIYIQHYLRNYKYRSSRPDKALKKAKEHKRTRSPNSKLQRSLFFSPLLTHRQQLGR